jgi:pimeloyl-ACP methyl ester carboxylesterase
MLNIGSTASSHVELFYEDVGRGKPVVLIHGWPLSGRAFEKQVPALVSAGHRVITYDRRGFGRSSQPWTGYDYDTLAGDLHALLRHLDLREVTLVGFSIGRHGSERVRKAVLAAAVPPYLYKGDDNPDGALDDDTIAQFEKGVTTDRIGFLEEFTKDFFSNGTGEALLSEPARRYHRDIAAFASPKGTLDCIGAFARTDFRGDLARFDVPTLVLHGDADQIVPFEVSGKRAHAAIRGSDLALIEGGPHGLNATHAGAFNDALLAFLQK